MTQLTNSSRSTTVAIKPTAAEQLDVTQLEQWLWDAACEIRGATDAPKYKDFILPLVFYKRLSDVFDDEFAGHVGRYGDEQLARRVLADDHADALRKARRPIIRFIIPEEYAWGRLRHHGSGGLGEFVTNALRTVAELNPDLKGVLDVKDYNERQSGQRTLDDDRLEALIEVLSRHRLGLKNTEPDILGRAYEYLLRKFAEGQGQSAGEFYTPKEVGWLLAHLIDPQPRRTCYDPTCGSAGLLIKARLYYEQQRPGQRSQAPHLYGQELNPITFAMAKMNMFLHDFADAFFAIGDTLRQPGFGAAGAARLQQFDYVVANPMWNQKNYGGKFYEDDRWNRFQKDAPPPSSSADWGWLQHIAASLKEGGQAAVVLDTGAASRGSGSQAGNKEKTLRRHFVEKDWIEGVVLLPENLFYNTTAPGIIILLNRGKPEGRRGQIMLANASNYFVKEKPKNVLTDEGIEAVSELFHNWESRERLSQVITLAQAREADYNLSPSLFVDVGEPVDHRPLPYILSDLQKARVVRERADTTLYSLLVDLGLEEKA
ncbi:MAG: type I restriction-modification system subunit M [Chloroflexi bacterium]|nr:type I restriction-modification system subunit M [Chloroflexota bacterium]MCI0646424.1 type I restriction-modification system subunit M [Chloroflexota bacterium]MCI0730184.1 type I restriction-modification system subunit M [Chloroflexota bacterium]